MYIILCDERKIKKVGPPRRSDDDSVFHVVWRLSWPTGRGEQVMFVTSATLSEAQTHVYPTEMFGDGGRQRLYVRHHLASGQ